MFGEAGARVPLTFRLAPRDAAGSLRRSSLPAPVRGRSLRTHARGSVFFVPFLRRATAINEKTRVNQQIRISPVRVIDQDGEQIGILPIEKALETAEQLGLDLVEVAPMAMPPVCRIMDYGKFKYEEQRKAREARKKQHQFQIKEVKMRPGIEDHDFDFKLKHARRFLEEGNKVKLTMMFRGRQMAHPEHGREVLNRVVVEVEDVGKVESSPSMEGRSMTMVLAPLK
jgi:translation initiation factor IF-3